MAISRRRFLGTVAALGVGLATGQAAAAQATTPASELPSVKRVVLPEEYEITVLTDFLNPQDKPPLDRKAAVWSSFDVEGAHNLSSNKTIQLMRARAVHIGGDLYLTAYHAVDEDQDKLTLSATDFSKDYPAERILSRKASVVAFDEKADIALLRAETFEWEKPSTKAALYLPAARPKEGNIVSYFHRALGVDLSAKDYGLTYRGSPFYADMEAFYKQQGVAYDPKRIPLGRSLLLAGERMLEEEGMVIPYRKSEIEAMYPEETDNICGPDIDCLSTGASFNGDSGSPMFRRTVKGGKAFYEFAGIIVRGHGRVEWVDTPGHPSHKKNMQHVTTVFLHRDPIEALLRGYMEKLQNKSGEARK